MSCDLQRSDRVVTPRDEVGFVINVTADGFVHGEYQGALLPGGAFFTLHCKLLVLWKPNTRRPEPYRAPLEVAT